MERNIKLPLLLDRTEPQSQDFEAIVGALGLEDKLNALPSQLSGGQQQRTAIARSLLYRPALLLADEPTGNLDQENSREIMAMLKRFNQTLKQTILVITHDELVARAADRVIWIEDGRIVSDAPAVGEV